MYKHYKIQHQEIERKKWNTVCQQQSYVHNEFIEIRNNDKQT